MEIINYIISKYSTDSSELCIYDDKIVIHFCCFNYDDAFHNGFNLTSLYMDYLELGDKTLIDDSKYFIDVEIDKLIVIKNNYHTVMRKLQDGIYLNG